VKLGSLVIAAVIISSADRDLSSALIMAVVVGGGSIGVLCPEGKPYIGNDDREGTADGGCWWCRPAGGGDWVRSMVMVGNGAEADSVAPPIIVEAEADA
jgi:hypothetical protein